MKVFEDIVGQKRAVSTLESAVKAASEGSETQEMTHAWLFTGPPGSGRSNIAIAFAAALVCKNGGCGSCTDCITAKSGTHPDVEVMRVEAVSIKIDEIRELVSRSSWGASISPWRIVIIEDCDRMTEAASNALLKALEEPGSQTIWLLCAPTLHDVIPTIRSRCRHINLITPTTQEVSNFLQHALNVEKDEAELAARISQGHLGKARYFLTNEDAPRLRKKSFEILFSARDIPSALSAADALLSLAKERAESRLQSLNEKEEEELRNAMQGTSGRGLISGGSKALKDLEKDQKSRLTRSVKDELDGYLLDFTTLLRDALSTPDSILNLDSQNVVAKIKASLTPEAITELTHSINRTRELLSTNAAQLLSLESLFLDLLAINRGN